MTFHFKTILPNIALKFIIKHIQFQNLWSVAVVHWWILMLLVRCHYHRIAAYYAAWWGRLAPTAAHDPNWVSLYGSFQGKPAAREAPFRAPSSRDRGEGEKGAGRQRWIGGAVPLGGRSISLLRAAFFRSWRGWDGSAAIGGSKVKAGASYVF